jgi:uncharacterized protein YaaR (DUF327 family)
MTREHVTRKFKEINMEDYKKLVEQYCDYCINSVKEVATGSGKIVQVRERHLPTMNYFLYHWLRIHHFDFYTKMNVWKIKQDPTHPYYVAIMETDDMFKALATDIVANEGKGIFYAKNALGMTDRAQTENTNIDTITIKYES